jgi:hypothetical protein
VTGLARWLVGLGAVVAIGAAVALSATGCENCDAPPADTCFGAPGASHQEACAACGAYYSGCRDGKWVMIPCGSAMPPTRDAGR